MLQNLMADALRSKGISGRAAAREIGVSHTTVVRILAGKPIDFDTLELVCKWLGISVSDVIQSDTSDNISARIAILVQKVPGMGELLADAVVKMDAGELSEEDVREIIAYATYRIGVGSAKRGLSSRDR